MEIHKNKVVMIDYTLTDADGAVLDSSQGEEPLAYIQGTESIIPGLENALEGRAPGEKFTVSIPPAEAYGERDEALLQDVPREVFRGKEELLKVGAHFQAQDDEGMHSFTIVGVNDEVIRVDGNHPLAGVTLNFDVTVVDVRDASPEELSHGHVHGPNGHGH
jgi:FKBP-type peptidyl-prolyl cis-trans isomerase SlyD